MSPDPDRPVTHQRLTYEEPFDGPGLIAFLKRRAVPGVEEVVDGVYRRSLSLPGGAGILQLQPNHGYVEARLWLDYQDDLESAVQRSRALFDLDANPSAVIATLGQDPLIGALVKAQPGRRVPGVVDGDELAIRAVLGQQVSLAGAATLAHRLVLACGAKLDRPSGTITHRFPKPKTIAAVDPESLAMPRSRRAALLGLARALADGRVSLHPDADREQTRRRLLDLPGIGPWTADYIGMRALHDPDVFLASDLGVRHALQALGADGRPTQAERLSERWRPYRSYAVQHLWAHLVTLP